MKKTKLLGFALAGALLVGSLTGCGKGGDPKGPELPEFIFDAELESGVSSLKVGETETLLITESGDEEVEHVYSYSSSDESVLTVDEEGNVTAVGVGTADITIYEEESDSTIIITIETYDKDPLSGLASYKGEDGETRTEILGKLEKYAMDKHLTGVSLFENGGYVMYNPRVQKGTENYITGYGFGILSEGNITEDLASETNPNWKRYYHSAASNDPKNINHLNASGSEVSDLASYVTSSYWGVRMNETKDGYTWYGSLSKDDRPIPCKIVDGEVVEDETLATSNVWKFHIRTGEDGVKYSTKSTKTLFGTDLSSFDGRGVTVEDYLYGYQLLLTGGFELYRGAEKAADKDYGIVGAAQYFAATEHATESDAELFSETVGVSAGKDDEGDFLVIQTTAKHTPFYAMYGLNSNLVQPLPKDFVKAIGNGDEAQGVKNLGAYIEGHNVTPVDTWLSLGTMTLEYWEEDKAIVFGRNAEWFETKANPNINRIPGVKITVYPGAKNDNTLVIKEFLDGKLDASGIPTVDYLKQYRDDPRTTTTTGDSVFKLNMNSCTPEEWETLFGEEGTVAQTVKSQYWDVKPWMSNDNFLDGINAAIDRKTFAENRGVIPSNNYFSSNYMIDPENGISYNTTDAHDAAMEDYYPDTFGYNETAAKIYFRRAVEELVENGQLELGTKSTPTQISIEIWWMYESDITDYGDEISGYIEGAFNDEFVADGRVKLDISNQAVTQWDLVYYDHLMVGQFDLGFGSISGNAYDPINFFEVLRSDNSSGFTLNWGTDTSVNDGDLVYDGRTWSFNALWAAANNYVYAVDGEEAALYGVTQINQVGFTADGGLVVSIDVYCVNSDTIVTMLYSMCIFATNDTANYSDYGELYVYFNSSDDLESGNSIWQQTQPNENGVYTVTVMFAPEIVAAFKQVYGESPAIWGVDFYFYVAIEGFYEPTAPEYAGGLNLTSIKLP